MTADEWINMKEVDEMHLPEYLQQLKRDGWSLVGLEQTMSSVDLREAVFPEKMVLILGNEKEGVPAEIIQVGEKEGTQRKIVLIDRREITDGFIEIMRLEIDEISAFVLVETP